MKVRQQLQDKGLVPDDWGGDTIFVECSALTKTGIDKLLEMILLQADLLELKANPEPQRERQRHRIRRRTRRPDGDSSGSQRHAACRRYYFVRRILRSRPRAHQRRRPAAQGSRAVGGRARARFERRAGCGLGILWLSKTKKPRANWPNSVFLKRAPPARKTKKSRSKIFLPRSPRIRTKCSRSSSRRTRKARSRPLSRRSKKSRRKKFRSKSSTATSARSRKTTWRSHPLRARSFSVFTRALDSTAAEKAKHAGVQIKLYAIIYELIDQVKEAMAGLLDPLVKDIVVGSAEMRQVFELSKGVPVAGCMVSSGRIVKGKVRVRRRKDVIYEGICAIAPPFSGRGQRSSRRNGMRHPHRRLQRFQGRRRD